MYFPVSLTHWMATLLLVTTTVFTVSSGHSKQNSFIFNSDYSKCSVWHHRAEVHKETLEMLIWCVCVHQR